MNRCNSHYVLLHTYRKGYRPAHCSCRPATARKRLAKFWAEDGRDEQMGCLALTGKGNQEGGKGGRWTVLLALELCKWIGRVGYHY